MLIVIFIVVFALVVTELVVNDPLPVLKTKTKVDCETYKSPEIGNKAVSFGGFTVTLLGSLIVFIHAVFYRANPLPTTDAVLYMLVCLFIVLSLLYNRHLNPDETAKICAAELDAKADDEGDDDADNKPEPVDLVFDLSEDTGFFIRISAYALVIFTLALLMFFNYDRWFLYGVLMAFVAFIIVPYEINNFYEGVKPRKPVEDTLPGADAGAEDVKVIKVPVNPSSKEFKFTPMNYTQLVFIDDTGETVSELDLDDIKKCDSKPVCKDGRSITAKFDVPIGQIVIRGLNPSLKEGVEPVIDLSTNAEAPLEGVNSRSVDATYGVELFDKVEFRGKSTGVLHPGDYHFAGDLNNSTRLSSNFNDNIKSLKVDKGFQVIVFNHYPTTSGSDTMVYQASTRDLGEFKGKISSVRVQRI